MIKAANNFIEKYFEYDDFNITSVKDEEEAHIIYATKNNKKYAIYTYHFIDEPTIEIDRKFIQNIYDNTPKDTVCLMVYFRAKISDKEKEKYEYVACNSDEQFEVWKIDMVENKPMVIYYPRKTFFDLIHELYKVTSNNREDEIEFLVRGKVDEDGRELHKTRVVEEIKKRMCGEDTAIEIGFLKCNDLVYSLVLVINQREYIGIETADRYLAPDEDIDYIKSVDFYKIQIDDEIVIDNNYFKNMR